MRREAESLTVIVQFLQILFVIMLQEDAQLVRVHVVDGEHVNAAKRALILIGLDAVAHHS